MTGRSAPVRIRPQKGLAGVAPDAVVAAGPLIVERAYTDTALEPCGQDRYKSLQVKLRRVERRNRAEGSG